MSAPTFPLLDRLFDAIGRCLNREAARALVELRADPEVQARAKELAEKCNEGKLSAEERAEYEAYVQVSDFIAILKSKARLFLARERAAS